MKSFRPSLGYRNPLRDRFSDTFFETLPEDPGVYFMRDRKNRVIYVGKAKSLRTRLLSYRNAKPGAVGENVVELLERVRAIDWETHASEDVAVRRELELIHALTPAYNIAACWEEDYLFLGLRLAGEGRWEFRLTSEEAECADGTFEYFGCFKHRRRTKSAYLSLLRLLYASANRKPRFSFPAQIARFTPKYEYTLRNAPDEATFALVRRFFRGEGDDLLPHLLERMLENETIPPFMRPGLQEDFDAVRGFYVDVVLANGRPKAGAVISHDELRNRIRATVPTPKAREREVG
jgi:excinuclease UvrABC nuclease subunit